MGLPQAQLERHDPLAGRHVTVGLITIRRRRVVPLWYRLFSSHGRNCHRYIGAATAGTRAEALQLAWDQAQERGLLPTPIEI